MKLPNKLLIASVIGLGPTLLVAKLFEKKLEENVKKSTLYREAMNALREHEGAVYFLGRPIEDSKTKFNNLGLLFNDFSELKVNVKGSKADGKVFICVKRNKDDSLFLDYVQLQIGNDTSKRLVIKKSVEETASIPKT